MKFRFPLGMVLAAIIFTLIATPVSAQIADGTYQVPYEMKEQSSDNTSIADGYFVSPATLTVENGVQTVSLTVTGSNYIESLSTPAGAVNVVSEDSANETRTVSFRVDGDLSQPLNMDMHIVVPDLYDTVHTARAVFNASGLPQAGAQASTDAGETSTSGETSGATDESTANVGGEVVENPKTGEETPIVLYTVLLLVSGIALISIWKFRPARN
ncbi:NEAT domain-containing protein [Oceanobacillus alkalisoli]|uniref:NEAT domain-containing protein n=1 Tax=Oceanobacillus alkalisoli TaxID=2925113 RepID=UPI001EEFF096|nr:NEAT domain-containing protein [Oceanobacillus alkalisoli]MCF3943390.1 NEAT domain-containing protein [Oceanobacillus alkalisoli]MCG5103979.1 NEAT domain-containing protein [Oceanobacillus alkalisoli]